MKIEAQNSDKPQKPQLNILAVMCRTFSNMFFWFGIQLFDSRKKSMVGLITLSLVKFSDGNIATCQLHFVNNGDLNGYTKAMIITMTAIIIALQLGVCKSRMAHNVLQLGDGAKFGTADFRLLMNFLRKINVIKPQILPYCQIAVMLSLRFIND